MSIVIVDAYATGADLQRYLAARCADCVHVASDAELPASFSANFPAANYVATLDSRTMTFDELIDRLTDLRVTAVTPGTESGVALAEQIGSAMGLPSNDPTTVMHRRDKQEMVDRVRERGLHAARSRRFTTFREACDWVRREQLAEVVIKPSGSAGTDRVRFCRSIDQVRQAADDIISATDIAGHQNADFVVQERLIGPEYFCNTVSADGRHKFAEIWRYHKTDHPAGSPIYDYEEYVSYDEADALGLVSYCSDVLDVLGVQEGAAHTEMIMTASGPAIVETNARLGGGTVPDVVDEFLGKSQTALLTDLLIDRGSLDLFDDRIRPPAATVWNVAFQNRRAGAVSDLSIIEAIESLPSVIKVVHRLSAGITAPETTSLLTCPGFAFLASASPGDVARDRAEIRRLEQEISYTRSV